MQFEDTRSGINKIYAVRELVEETKCSAADLKREEEEHTLSLVSVGPSTSLLLIFMMGRAECMRYIILTRN